MPKVEPVTPEGASASPFGLFHAVNCDQIALRYRVTRDNFSVPKLLAFFNKETEEEADGFFVVLRTLDPEKLDYHMHFRWEFGKERVTLYVSFHIGVLRKREGEHEPYAEQFMPWFGTFFSNESAHADLHSQFEYSIEGRQSRFPLPLRMSIDDLGAEIDGISMSLASLPEGMASAKVQHWKKHLIVELRGSTRTTFATFDLQHEVNRLSSLALRLTETRSTK